MYHFRKDRNGLPLPLPLPSYTHLALSYNLKRQPSLIAILTYPPESACYRKPLEFSFFSGTKSYAMECTHLYHTRPTPYPDLLFAPG